MSHKDLIQAVFRPEVQAMSAYKVTDASGFIKLDAMENPYSWPESITDQWLQTLRNCPLNRYPDPEAKQLSKTLKQYNGIPDNCDILLGNGSDEIIQLLLMGLPPTSSVLAPEPGFVMYRQIAQCLGLNYRAVPLLADSFELDLPAMLESIDRYQPALIFLAYPNNPTGNLFNELNIREIIKQAPGLVILDEAYAPFAGASFISALQEFNNLLVMRTVSKLGLAGLRLGYVTGAPAIIEQLHKLRLPYNINILTQISADFALSNKDLFDRQTRNICAERARVYQHLTLFDKIIVYPSAANFILFRTMENCSDRIFSFLKKQKILIKNLAPQKGLLTDCLRVTIGKPEENNAFLTALKNSFS